MLYYTILYCKITEYKIRRSWEVEETEGSGKSDLEAVPWSRKKVHERNRPWKGFRSWDEWRIYQKNFVRVEC